MQHILDRLKSLKEDPSVKFERQYLVKEQPDTKASFDFDESQKRFLSYAKELMD